MAAQRETYFSNSQAQQGLKTDVILDSSLNLISPQISKIEVVIVAISQCFKDYKKLFLQVAVHIVNNSTINVIVITRKDERRKVNINHYPSKLKFHNKKNDKVF